MHVTASHAAAGCLHGSSYIPALDGEQQRAMVLKHRFLRLRAAVLAQVHYVDLFTMATKPLLFSSPPWLFSACCAQPDDTLLESGGRLCQHNHRARNLEEIDRDGVHRAKMDDLIVLLCGCGGGGFPKGRREGEEDDD